MLRICCEPESRLQAMRSHEGNEAQVCYFIIQLLLLKPNDFRNRVSDFVKENAPEHWLQSDWHTKHMSYHKVGICPRRGRAPLLAAVL